MLQPDECYYRAEFDPAAPEIAIEVVLTSGGVDKLAIYAGLRVREVWFWTEEGGFDVHQLVGDRYEAIDRSALLPELDFTALARFVRMENQYEAVLAYHAHLRGAQ